MSDKKVFVCHVRIVLLKTSNYQTPASKARPRCNIQIISPCLNFVYFVEDYQKAAGIQINAYIKMCSYDKSIFSLYTNLGARPKLINCVYAFRKSGQRQHSVYTAF